MDKCLNMMRKKAKEILINPGLLKIGKGLPLNNSVKNVFNEVLRYSEKKKN